MAGKQDLLLAGKKKLEEFRKKKAAEKAKKNTSNSQFHPAGAGLHEKQFLESDPVRVTGSDGAGTSNGVIEPSGKNMESDYRTNLGSSNDIHTNTALSANNYDVHSLDPFQTSAKDEEIRRAPTEPVNINTSPNDKGTIYNHAISSETSARFADGIGREHITSSYLPSVKDSDSSSKHNNYGSGISYSKDNDTRLKDASESDTSLVSKKYGSVLSHKSMYNDLRAGVPRSYSSQSNGESVFHTTGVNEAFEDEQTTDTVSAHGYNQISEMGGSKFSSFVGHLTSTSSPFNSNESRSLSVSSDGRSASDQMPVALSVVGTNTRRSRPSFLDSIKTSSISSTPVPPIIPPPIIPQNVDSFNLKIHAVESQTSSASQDSFNAFASSNGHSLFRHDGSRNNFESTPSFYSTKQNEDFAALEQHIEDLTQEKFSLQRTLEASRTLAESLASENSALTDSYNQQGSVVHQLRSDMENLQEEIKSHLVELESLKVEYTNAQLECNAADERAKLLASEVIGLEEKALRLRSSELKLERQLENSQAEISSLRKKITSLEKDRQDLQMTINALQEEKKLLQSKLRKASTSEKFADVSKGPNLDKKNASTSTEDFDSTADASNHEMQSAGFLLNSDGSASENRQYSLEGLSPSVVPPDQMRMIESINTLISELALEKEELLHALSVESSQSSKLKDLNKELSRKLEIQTQRLELLTAQTMANDSVPARQPDSFIIPKNTPYADEGDEVVERVLGWIMKLFPGGPSRRRTSKLL